ncbi:MAG: lysylphosphatidylglycerol synthase transmembrane domain-containing protein [Nanoarchaeota archaeon]
MKRTYKIVLVSIITVVLVWWLLSKVAFADIAKALVSVGPYWLALSFILYILSTTLRAARFLLTIKGITLPAMLRIVFLHNLSNNILPSFLGELSFVYLVKKTGKATVGEATATLLVSRIFDLCAVFGLTAVALLFVSNAPSQFSSLLIGFGMLLLMLFLLLGWVLLFRHRMLGVTDALLSLLRIRHLHIIEYCRAKVHETVDALERVHSLRTYLMLASVSLGVWLLAYAQVYVLLSAMGFGVSFFTAALGTSLYRIASNLPVYGIGGFGTVELTWSAAFVLLGMSSQAAIVSGFSVHIITLSYAVLLGVIATWLHARE